MAVASAGPYANNLHLSSRQTTTLTPHHSVFYRPDSEYECVFTPHSECGRVFTVGSECESVFTPRKAITAC